ncbi:MAG: hypothetical protein WD342_16240, partial [Verrucomicrobiales bacterium]
VLSFSKPLAGCRNSLFQPHRSVSTLRPGLEGVQRLSRRPRLWVSVGLFVWGFIFLLLVWVFVLPSVVWGLMLLPLAVVCALVDRKQFLCGACGNEVGLESVVCPVCGASLVRGKSGRNRSRFGSRARA